MKDATVVKGGSADVSSNRDRLLSTTSVEIASSPGGRDERFASALSSASSSAAVHTATASRLIFLVWRYKLAGKEKKSTHYPATTFIDTLTRQFHAPHKTKQLSQLCMK